MSYKDIQLTDKFNGPGGSTYYCIDKGQNSLLAIEVAGLNNNYIDETSLLSTTPIVAPILMFSFYNSFKINIFHPGYKNTVIQKTIKKKFEFLRNKAPYKRFSPILKFDRTAPDGHIYHPYSLSFKGEIPDLIYLLNIYTDDLCEIPAIEFLSWGVTQNEDFEKLNKKYNVKGLG